MLVAGMSVVGVSVVGMTADETKSGEARTESPRKRMSETMGLGRKER